MPSDIAKKIVDQIFTDDKASAIDTTKDALNGFTYDLIQQQKLNFAKTMGFDLGDTAQDSAEEIADTVYDDSPETPETEEETNDETDS